MQLERASIAEEINLSGIAVHSGLETNLRILPTSQKGVSFTRTDLPHRPQLQARYDNVIDTSFNTTIANENGDRISTIEHLMAALWGCAINDAEIEIEGSEVPVMDGSSQVFVDAIRKAGRKSTGIKQECLYIKKAVRVTVDNDGWAQFTPADNFKLSVAIDFPNESIGKQSFGIEAATSGEVDFGKNFASARTFGFYEDLERMRAMGLAQGASLENTIAIKEGKIMNDALRYDNEFARHKALDALGDLALAEMPIIGHFESYKGGHSLNNQLLHALFADDSCYTIGHGS